MDTYELPCHEVTSTNMTYPDKPLCTVNQYCGRLTDLSMPYIQGPDGLQNQSYLLGVMLYGNMATLLRRLRQEDLQFEASL
jgi:hypothetical protein